MNTAIADARIAAKSRASPDARLPDGFGDQLISDWDTFLGSAVWGHANAIEAGSPHVGEIKAARRLNKDQFGALTSARDALRKIAPERSALAEIEAGSLSAAERVQTDFAMVDRIIGETVTYLVEKRTAIDRAASAKAAGKREDAFGSALKHQLADWWLRQGHEPTADPDGAYQRTLRLILAIKAKVDGKPIVQRKHLNVRGALGDNRRRAKAR